VVVSASPVLGTVIDGVFVGHLLPLPLHGPPTGIFKQPVAAPILLTESGLADDHQADRRVHGGPEKALHHYAADNYPVLAAAFPALENLLVPGSLGENLSTRGLTEETVCIGDIFRVGTARIQVSQPRSPCWKIDRRFDVSGLSRFIAERGITGWYYRVLEAGRIGPGDALQRVDRPAAAVSLRRLWQAHLSRRPDRDELEQIMRAPGLSPGWVRKLAERIEWLKRNPELKLHP
jgi:MOSC domain-containing protein YiiM